LQIAIRFFEIRRSHLDKIQMRRRVQGNVSMFSLFTDHLAMHLAFWRHIDYQVTGHQGLAAQPSIIFQSMTFFTEPSLDSPPGGKMARPRADTMLGEITFCTQNLTTATNASATTYRIDIYAQTPSSIQQASSHLEMTAPPGWCKYYFFFVLFQTVTKTLNFPG
jgi:hypothetical protein